MGQSLIWSTCMCFILSRLGAFPHTPVISFHGSHHSLEALLRLRCTKTTEPGAIVASALTALCKLQCQCET